MKINVLITAYAVNPFKGSEDGIAWNIIRHLASHSNITAVTRRNNRPHIERYLHSHPLAAGQQLQFEYFDLPRWVGFWKKGSRGALLYHYLWHLGVVFFILKKRFRFDIAHHLNFNADWQPSFLWLLGKPFLWGPVGHHHKIPRPYILPHGKRQWLKDRLMWWVKCYFWKLDPFVKITKWSAFRVIGLNTSVFDVLGVPAEKQAHIPAAGNTVPEVPETTTDIFRVLSIGRFVPLKGFDLTVRAFAGCYHGQAPESQARMQLTLIGKGPQRTELEQLAETLQLPGQAVQFVDWLNREELNRYFASSKVFLFPSHEGAGMVVPEALSFGLPVICFDNYGPGEFVNDGCGIKVPYTGYDQSVQAFSLALEKLLHDEPLRRCMAGDASEHFLKNFTWPGKALRIQAIYERMMQPKTAVAPATI